MHSSIDPTQSDVRHYSDEKFERITLIGQVLQMRRSVEDFLVLLGGETSQKRLIALLGRDDGSIAMLGGDLETVSEELHNMIHRLMLNVRAVE